MFKQGELVKLKSGGPVMTVEAIGDKSFGGGPGIICVWFEASGNEKPHRETFPPFVLEKAK